MGRKHWPGCDGNHPITAGCNGGYGERVRAQIDADIAAERARTWAAWETELKAFAHVVAPWAAQWDTLASWEKIWLSNMYIGTGRFWRDRLGPTATKLFHSVPDGWYDSLPKDDQSGD